MSNEKKQPPESGSVPSKPFVISRLFRAPKDLLFRVWTDPEHLKHWWGPKDVRVTVKKLEMGVEAPLVRKRFAELEGDVQSSVSLWLLLRARVALPGEQALDLGSGARLTVVAMKDSKPTEVTWLQSL